MTSSQRRTLEETIAKYKRTKTPLHDVYVEGPGDKKLLDWHARWRGKTAPAVYSIGSIEIPETVVTALHLNAGSNRSRVIALATLLESEIRGRHPVKFLIDRDQQDYLPATSFSPSVVLTDLGTFELSFIHKSAFEKLLSILGGSHCDHDALRLATFNMAKQVYFVRAAAKKLGLSLKILDPSDFISAGLNLDLEGYVSRCVDASGLRAELSSLISEMSKCQEFAMRSGLGDARFVNDHDLHKILLKGLRLQGVGAGKSQDALRDLLLMGAELSSIPRAGMFEELYRTDVDV